MGYTHYWRKSPKIKARAWGEAVATAQRLLRSAPCRLEIEHVKERIQDPETVRAALRKAWPDRPRAPMGLVGHGVYERHAREVNQFEERIRATVPDKPYEALYVNGAAPDDFETFAIPLRVAYVRDFDFCKTGCRPYDLVVVGVLCILAEAGLAVTSDGDANDWEAGRAWAQGVLRRPVKIPKGIGPCEHAKAANG